MSNITPGLSVSQILKSKATLQPPTEDEPKKKSREDWRKAKELEEARKAGTAPAAVDEEGKDINPHIPQYIASAPWYYGTSGPTLKHQRPQSDDQTNLSHLDETYQRGPDLTKPTATKYRKGACENCGALTHIRKDCLERPRKVGARYTHAFIAPDERPQRPLALGYAGKRDRWIGYDAADHQSVVDEFQKVEEAKRQLRADRLNANDDGSDQEENDEDKYVDDIDMPGTKVDSKQRITVRNLRIREDTAKYLRNLDPNSAYYDPKTRSMREDPNAVPSRDELFSGENFVRFSGDTNRHANAQLFAWEAYEKGVDVHLLAEPTKLELLQKEYEKKKEQFKTKVQGGILDRYGGEEHLEAPPKTLLLAQTEDYVEYSRSGRVIKGVEKEVIKSKYEEDVYVNNHTSVWGSYWRGGTWGYKCCHSFVKNSYCLGEAGRSENAQQPVVEQQVEESVDKSSSDTSEEEEEQKSDRKSTKKKDKKRKNKQKRKQKKEEAKSKLQEALDEEEKNTKKANHLLSLDERKRPYNSMFEVKKPSEEEIEAYYMKRKREDDPMNQFL